jgi:hypothetical protein
VRLVGVNRVGSPSFRRSQIHHFIPGAFLGRGLREFRIMRGALLSRLCRLEVCLFTQATCLRLGGG